MAQLSSCSFRRKAGTNTSVKSILIMNNLLEAGLTIPSQKVPDNF